MRRQSKWLSFIAFRWLVTLIAFIFIAYLFHKYSHLITPWLDETGRFSWCFFLLLYCLMSVFCLPNVILALAGGALFGLVEGTILNVLGATLGALCGFCLSRYVLPHAFVVDEKTRMGRLINQVDRRGWKSVALLRLTPAMPYHLVNYGLGMTHIKLSHYLMVTLISLIPNKFILTYCGYEGIRFFS